jgi:hypothetical protein
MKRTTLVEYEDASPAVQAIYDEIMNTMGTPSVLNFLKALGNNEHVLRATWTMLKETVIEGEIPALLKQLILFKVSISVGFFSVMMNMLVDAYEVPWEAPFPP